MFVHLITELRNCSIAWSAVALLGLASCGGGTTVAGQPIPDTGGTTPVIESPVNNPVDTGGLLGSILDSPSRLVSAGDEGYLAMHFGAEYAAELGFGNCTVSGVDVALNPSWDVSSSAINDAAYCVYRLLLDPAGNTELEFIWNGNAPTAGNCWIGLSNWAADSWDWQELTAANVISISNAAQHSTGADHCLAAVVALGTDSRNLYSIGFNDEPTLSYPIVDSGQDEAFDDSGNVISPASGQPYYGQDSQYNGNALSYTDNGDGTITDNVTGLMWAQTPNNMSKVTFDDAFTVADNLVLGGHDDWRVPTIKELYSLIDFRGITGMSELDALPYIDTDFFDFEYGDEDAGERHIDAQYWSGTEYVSTTMGGSATTFGVNFADGRIKGYGRQNPMGGEMEQFIRCVRDATDYGINNFHDNGNGTIDDQATGLTWMQIDSGDLNAGPLSDGTMNWEDALDWSENLDYAGHDDWRLPNAKELQSILDYSRSPATTGTAAIDPLFSCTGILDEGSSPDYAFYWTSTSHLDGPPDLLGNYACYVAFGTALGFMEQPPGSGSYNLLDVHGAGAQRSDPKDGNPDDYPNGHGPQGDVIRIFNMVRCVRGGL